MRPQLFFRAVGIALALMTAITAGARPVWAHAVIIEAKPAVGAIVPPGPVQVILHYNSRIDHARSRLTLVGPDRKPQPIAIDNDSAPDLITANIADLPAGDYRLRWQVLAIDGHLTRGDIPFSVKSEQTN
jgi:methionine-rich copper-binding protein CopC